MMQTIRNTLADILDWLAGLVRVQGAGGPGPINPPPTDPK